MEGTHLQGLGALHVSVIPCTAAAARGCSYTCRTIPHDRTRAHYFRELDDNDMELLYCVAEAWLESGLQGVGAGLRKDFLLTLINALSETKDSGHKFAGKHSEKILKSFMESRSTCYARGVS